MRNLLYAHLFLVRFCRKIWWNSKLDIQCVSTCSLIRAWIHLLQCVQEYVKRAVCLLWHGIWAFLMLVKLKTFHCQSSLTRNTFYGHFHDNDAKVIFVQLSCIHICTQPKCMDRNIWFPSILMWKVNTIVVLFASNNA